MANEITVGGSLVYDDSESDAVSLAVQELSLSITTKLSMRGKIVVGLTEVAIPLGSIATPGYSIFVNRDTTNTVWVRTKTGGDKFAKLGPGECCMQRLGPDAQAPYAIASAAGCHLEYLILET